MPDALPSWRYSLENPHTGERVGFRTADEVGRFLGQWIAAPPVEERLNDDTNKPGNE